MTISLNNYTFNPLATGFIARCVIQDGGQIYIKPPIKICGEIGNPEGGGVRNPGSYISSLFGRSIGINICLVSMIVCFSTFKACSSNVLTYVHTQGRNRIREMSLNAGSIGDHTSFPWLVAWQLSCLFCCVLCKKP